MMFDVNVMSVVIAAVVSMALGGLWYSPILFAKQWMRLGGMTQADMDATKAKGVWKMYLFGFLAALVMAYVLAHFVALWKSVEGSIDVMGAVSLGFWIWLGFMATILVGQVLWERKPWGYFSINAGYWLVSVVLMAVILTLF